MGKPLKRVLEPKGPLLEAALAAEITTLANRGGYSEDVQRAFEAIAAVNLEAKKHFSKSPLVRALKESPVDAVIQRMGMRPAIGTMPSGSWGTAWTHKGSAIDGACVVAILGAANQRLLDRFMRCHCGEFFLKRTEEQTSHSARCRERKFKSTKEWKEHRREYMRQYYKLQKSGKVK